MSRRGRRECACSLTKWVVRWAARREPGSPNPRSREGRAPARPQTPRRGVSTMALGFSIRLQGRVADPARACHTIVGFARPARGLASVYLHALGADQEQSMPIARSQQFAPVNGLPGDMTPVVIASEARQSRFVPRARKPDCHVVRPGVLLATTRGVCSLLRHSGNLPISTLALRSTDAYAPRCVGWSWTSFPRMRESRAGKAFN